MKSNMGMESHSSIETSNLRCGTTPLVDEPGPHGLDETDAMKPQATRLGLRRSKPGATMANTPASVDNQEIGLRTSTISSSLARATASHKMIARTTWAIGCYRGMESTVPGPFGSKGNAVRAASPVH